MPLDPVPKKNPSTFVIIGAVLCISAAVAVVVTWKGWFEKDMAPMYSSDAIAQAGQIGDKFGALNTLFTGLAFVGLLATLVFHYVDQESGKADLNATLTAQRETTEALRTLAEVANKQIEEERAATKAAQDREEEAVLLAIFEEFSFSWENYQGRMKPTIEALKKGEFLNLRLPPIREVFPVTKAHLPQLGKIRRARLRRAVVRAGTRNITMLAALELNATIIKEFAASEEKFRQNPTDGRITEIHGEDRERAITYAQTISHIHQLLTKEMEELLAEFAAAGIK